MRSRVELVADRADDGRPVLVRMQAEGSLAVRRTGPSTVHLVGAAAGPLGGDVIEVRVHVRAGATLTLRSVAATLALPGPRGDRADVALEVTVERDADLDVALEPLVVCRASRLHTTTALSVDSGARVLVREQVVLGRCGEVGGDWTGRTVVDAGGRPVLRTALRSRTLAGPGTGVRALVTSLLLGDAAGRYADGPEHPHHGDGVTGAVVGRLAGGGLLVTATGADLAAAVHHHDAALELAAVAVPSGVAPPAT